MVYFMLKIPVIFNNMNQEMFNPDFTGKVKINALWLVVKYF